MLFARHSNLTRATKNLSSGQSQLMNGHIVGYSRLTLKLRNGKTWRWTQPWANCTGKAKKNQQHTEGARPRLLCRPSRHSRGCVQLPRQGCRLQQPPTHSGKVLNSRPHPSRGAEEAGVLPIDDGSHSRPNLKRPSSPLLRPAPPTTPAGRRHGLGYSSQAL